MKILIAGFQHETNTFAPSKADYENFVRGEGFPAMVRKDDLFQLQQVNIPIGGFIQEMQAEGHHLIPVIWAAASPSAHVTRSAYERIAGEIVEAVRVTQVDAIYLDLHGAMVADHVDDGEGELLARIRSIVGSDIPVVASLDLHANVTEQMLRNASGLVAYRTYPHVDMADTGRAAARLLRRLMASDTPVTMAYRRIPFLIPVNAMCTLLEPARSIYAHLAAQQNKDVLSISFTPGFPAADFPECGPMVWCYASEPGQADAAVAAIYDEIIERESEWAVEFLEPDEAVHEAQRIASRASRPVIIADTQDNPHGGADSNTTGMLRALVRNKAHGAALGLMWDPEVARMAHEAGKGSYISVALGGKSGVIGDVPFEATFEVEHLSDGKCVFDGPMMHGMHVDVGPTACLRIDGVRVAVSSVKAPMNDRNLFRMAGIQPETMKILVNKSSVHFRADFGPIAERILVAKSPGPMAADPADLPWKRLGAGMRVRPAVGSNSSQATAMASGQTNNQPTFGVSK
jgi:microcystin degradation protein MlrC